MKLPSLSQLPFSISVFGGLEFQNANFVAFFRFAICFFADVPDFSCDYIRFQQIVVVYEFRAKPSEHLDVGDDWQPESSKIPLSWRVNTDWSSIWPATPVLHMCEH